MKKILCLIAVNMAAAASFAQQPGKDDPIGRYLFPPELIMGHSQELALKDRQRAAIKGEVQKAQSKFVDVQWEMQEEGQKMEKLLRQVPADETRILEQADRIMNLEREIKKTHLSLLIRLKNLLTPEQITRLEGFRRESAR